MSAAPKRYFAYATSFDGVMVRYHAYFDKLGEAKRYAKINAEVWGGYWAVSDTTKEEGKMTVAHGKSKLSKPKKEEAPRPVARSMPSPYRPQAVRWHQ